MWMLLLPSVTEDLNNADLPFPAGSLLSLPAFEKKLVEMVLRNGRSSCESGHKWLPEGEVIKMLCD